MLSLLFSVLGHTDVNEEDGNVSQKAANFRLHAFDGSNFSGPGPSVLIRRIVGVSSPGRQPPMMRFIQENWRYNMSSVGRKCKNTSYDVSNIL